MRSASGRSLAVAARVLADRRPVARETAPDPRQRLDDVRVAAERLDRREPHEERLAEDVLAAAPRLGREALEIAAEALRARGVHLVEHRAVGVRRGLELRRDVPRVRAHDLVRRRAADPVLEEVRRDRP
jgi:hypothetical protein